MQKEKLLKGSSLFALARSKARDLTIETKGVKLAELITRIQKKEGHTACFRAKETCTELGCCWQLSCGAAMEDDS